MGFGTTFAMLSFLLIFAGMTVFVVNVQQNITGSATAIREQSQSSLEAQQQAISITNANYQLNQEIDWKITYADEFQQGTFDQTTTVGDAVGLAGTNTTGTYTSPAYNTGYNSNYTTISWNAIGTNEFQIRSADTLATLESEAFIGPDATSATVYDTPGAAIHTAHNTDQYIQYQVTLSGTTPELQDTTIGAIRPTGHAQLTIENTGSQKLNPEETDAYIDGVRIQRTSEYREYELQNLIDQRLWNPGEELTFTVFTTSPATITVNNNYAQDTENI